MQDAAGKATSDITARRCLRRRNHHAMAPVFRKMRSCPIHLEILNVIQNTQWQWITSAKDFLRLKVALRKCSAVAMPTWAAARAGASLMPSPAIPAGERRRNNDGRTRKVHDVRIVKIRPGVPRFFSRHERPLGPAVRQCPPFETVVETSLKATRP